MDGKETSTNEAVPETLEQAQRLTDLQIMNAHQEKLSRIAREIEAVLVKEELTWGEWGQIVEMFSNRIGQYVSLIKVDFLK